MFVGIRRLLVILVLNCVLILLTTVFEGIWLDSVYLAVALAAVLVIVNLFLPFVILLLSLPLNVYSLAVFAMFTNMIVLGLLGWFVPAFHVMDWQSWLGGSAVVGGANFVASWVAYRPVMRPINPADL